MEKEMTNSIIQDIEKQIDSLYQEREAIDDRLTEIRDEIVETLEKTGGDFLDNLAIRLLRDRAKAIDSEIQTLNQKALYERTKLTLNIRKEVQ
jgi:prefoldin subunit 5